MSSLAPNLGCVDEPRSVDRRPITANRDDRPAASKATGNLSGEARGGIGSATGAGFV